MVYFRSDSNLIDVNTGEVVVSANPIILRAPALGSCVAVIFYAPENKIGGLAHIMLPGTAPESEKEKLKYSYNALNELMNKFNFYKVDHNLIKIFIIGGADVLDQNSQVGESIISYLKKRIADMNLKITADETGGKERRSATIDIDRGIIYYTVAGSNLKILKTYNNGNLN